MHWRPGYHRPFLLETAAATDSDCRSRSEVHQWRIAQRTIDAYKRDKSMRAATGDLPL